MVSRRPAEKYRRHRCKVVCVDGWWLNASEATDAVVGQVAVRFRMCSDEGSRDVQFDAICEVPRQRQGVHARILMYSGRYLIKTR